MSRTLPTLTEREARALLDHIDSARGSQLPGPHWTVFTRALLKLQMLTDQSA